MCELNYLAEHKYYFKLHMCGCYPFTEESLEKNKENLNWNYLSINERLPWSIDFIEKYADNWFWEGLSENESLPWSDELIIRFAERWYWNNNGEYDQSSLIGNKAVKWTKNIILKYPDKFPGTWLAVHTELLNESPEIMEAFKDTLWWDYVSGNEYMNWSEELIDRFLPFWNWEILSANEGIHWTKRLKEKYRDKYDPKYCEKGYPELWINKRRAVDNYIKKPENTSPYTPDELKEILRNEPLTHLCYDDRIPWSEELIARYENGWDWGALSFNTKLPWSEKLIDRFIDKWDFGKGTEREDGEKAYTLGLSSNSGLPWSLEFIKKYESEWEWLTLTYSDCIPWSVDILKEFESRWEWDQMIWNETMWEKVFYPFLDDKKISELIIDDEEITQ